MFTLPDTSHNSIMADLVIHEFDQWSNPSDPTFYPTTICYDDHEVAGGC